MEQNTERKSLSFSKGMTNVPSDLLNDDTELLESLGFVYKDGELKPVQEPKAYDGAMAQCELVFVHKGADFCNYIGINKLNKNEDGTYNFYWYWSADGKPGHLDYAEIDNVIKEDVKAVNSVGNIVIVSTECSMYYFRYRKKTDQNGEKWNTYEYLGTELPKFKNICVNIRPGEVPYGKLAEFQKKEDRCIFGTQFAGSRRRFITDSATGNIMGWESYTPSATDSYKDTEYSWDFHMTKELSNSDFQTAVQGHVALKISDAKELNSFLFPFFVRLAFRLFDGTYARITNPILCFPTVRKQGRMVVTVYEPGTKIIRPTDIFGLNSVSKEDGDKAFAMWFVHGSLSVSFSIDGFSGWEDIVKEVVVFASDDVMTFHLEKDWTPKQPFDEGMPDSTISDQLMDMGEDGFNGGGKYWKLFTRKYNVNTGLRPVTSIVPQYKSDKDIMDELKTKTQFYKLFTLNNTDFDFTKPVSVFAEEQMKDGVLRNLTTQEQLNVDDYYGWARYTVDNLFNYNKRLNMFGLKRYSFDGFEEHVGTVGTLDRSETPDRLRFYVRVDKNARSYWVKSEVARFQRLKYCQSWFYYPDPDAKQVVIEQLYPNGEVRKKITMDLTEHPYLNGAYAMKYLPNAEELTYKDYEGSITADSKDNYELLDSQIYTSVVNNPFTFQASGDNTIGTGSIVGVAVNTEAISQGQFGQYPLLVFTTEGIYGMGVSSEGLYSNIYPVSRDVCNNQYSIIPTDKLVYFTSDKGLMAISGGTAACVTPQMAGRAPRNFATSDVMEFREFLKGCRIVYDYRDSLLRLMNENSDYQYIYSIADNTIGIIKDNIHPIAIANDYPDTLIQARDHRLYSLTGKPNVNDDTKIYDGRIVTRPLKFGGSVKLKSISEVKNLVDTDGGKIKMKIYGSNDCKHWQQLHSLRGKPWKYYVFDYELTNFLAKDSFAGTLVTCHEKRNDKMR